MLKFIWAILFILFLIGWSMNEQSEDFVPTFTEQCGDCDVCKYFP